MISANAWSATVRERSEPQALRSRPEGETWRPRPFYAVERGAAHTGTLMASTCGTRRGTLVSTPGRIRSWRIRRARDGAVSLASLRRAGPRKRGDDGGCFGGLPSTRSERGAAVLEQIPRSPMHKRRSDCSGPCSDDGAALLWCGWVTEVCQRAYGHRARKRTWLYAFGFDVSPPALDWSQPEPIATVGKCRNHGGGDLATPCIRRRPGPPASPSATPCWSTPVAPPLRPVADRQDARQ